MNRAFRIVFSRVRGKYVVVNEKSKGYMGGAVAAAAAAAMLLASGQAMAADPTAAELQKQITELQKQLKTLQDQIQPTNSAVLSGTKNVAIGSGASTSSYVNQHGQVAIGENALAWSGSGNQESMLRFGQSEADWPASVAIGKGSVARSGSVVIGDHGYQGKLGDIEISGSTGYDHMKYQQDVLSTAIGANSYANGALSSVTGAYSVISSKYNGSGGFNSLYATQNIGATIYGSLNSIESSAQGSNISGVANSVIGFANRTANANAALIWGTGNEITNSYESVSVSYTGWSSKSVSEAQRAAIAAMQSSDYAGGSVFAIGGGNKADGAFYSQLMGVQNKITGASAWDGAYFDLVDGYRNTVDQSSYVTVMGMHNTVNAGADYSIVIGNYHTIESGKTHNVIIGDADKETATSASDSVIIGHNANSSVDGGVAIGSYSVADTAKSAGGYNPLTGKTDYTDGTSAWTSTHAAVSVGGNGVTRQITNVAAGTNATDAVNVAQLMKAVQAAQDAAQASFIAGDNIAITEKEIDGKTYKVISATGITSGDKVIDVTPPSESGSGSSGTTGGESGASTNPAGNYTVTSKTEFKGDSGDTVTIGGSESASNALTVKGGASGSLTDGNIGVVADSSSNSLTVKLAKDVKGLDSVEANTFKAGDTTVTADGVTIADGPSFTKTNIDAAGNQIHNVADGTADTDAVNVSQLKASESRTDQKIKHLGDQMNEYQDENRAGIASAIAMASLPQAYLPGKNMLAAGAGYHKGKSALAIGLSSVSDSGSWIFKIQGSGNSEGDFDVGAGVGFQW